MFKVICIKSHSQSLIKEGKIYTVYSVKECKCGKNYDIGISFNTFSYCADCGKNYTDGVHWFASELFRPLDETFATEVLEQIKEQIEQEELVLI